MHLHRCSEANPNGRNATVQVLAMNTGGIGPTLGEVSAAHPQPVILLVEDEVVVREVTRKVLELAGYRVLESGSADDALRLAQEHAGMIGLLLTDVVMPGMNGADLAQRLEDAYPCLTTVYMSGYAEADILRKVIRRGPFLHIQKPFTVNFLLSRVAEAWQNHLAIRQKGGFEPLG